MKKVELNLCLCNKKHDYMREKVKKLCIAVGTLGVIMSITFLYSPVHAQCQNVVPDPLNPNCDPGQQSSVGVLVNRVVQFVPIVVTVVVIVAIARASGKLALADSPDKKQDAFKGMVNPAIAAVLFYSIWIVLYLIGYITGTDYFLLFG
jgi:hypothetical protein